MNGMMIKVLQIAVIAAWVIVNFITAYAMTAKKMKEKFVDGQCLVGRVCANAFYSVAWFLKAIKAAVLLTIA